MSYEFGGIFVVKMDPSADLNFGQEASIVFL